MIEFKRLAQLEISDFSLLRIINAILRRLKFPFELIIYFFPFGFNHINNKKIKSLHNIHEGERCFIIASGPSLKKIKGSRLGENLIHLVRI